MIRRQSPTSRQEKELATKSGRDLANIGDNSDPVTRLRLLCLSRGAHGILDLGRMFRRMDHHGSRLLNEHQFIDGLLESGLELTHDEARALFKRFDDNHSGKVDIDEFLEQLRPPLGESRIRVIKEAFHKMDKSKDGVITIDDLKNVYNVKCSARYISGEESEETIYNKFLGNFEHDQTRDGIVTWEEFLNYYGAMSASIDNDCYFDLMMRQCYKL